jgi:DNA mismatch repair protein MutS
MAVDSAEMDGLTPVMRQHRAAKEAHPDALLFFRMGDFYELFYEDAVIAARELQLMLTSRDKTKTVPMCGVPYHSAGPYLQRLLRKGYRVALCEQMEDPKLTKTIVRREVTRVLTPGTAVDASLEGSQSQWLASVAAVGLGAAACLAVRTPGLWRSMNWRGCSRRRCCSRGEVALAGRVRA